jgi:dipeptidyl-peptidase 4
MVVAALAWWMGAGLTATAVERPPDREAVYQSYLEGFDQLVSGGRISPTWFDDGSSFWYAKGGPDDRIIYRVDPVAGTKTPIFDVARLRNGLAKALGYELPFAGVPFDSFNELPDGRVEFYLEGLTWVADLQSCEVTRAPAESRRQAPDSRLEGTDEPPGTFQRLLILADPMPVPDVPSPDGKRSATVRDGNLALRAAEDGGMTILTTDAVADFGWDLESGRLVRTADGGMAPIDPWSPDGLQLFAMKVDRRHVPKVPRVHYPTASGKAEWIYAQRAGGSLDRAEPYLFDLRGRRTVPIEVGDTTDQYFVLLCWMRDGSEVWFARFSRDFKRVDILAADRSGRVRTVLTETSETFVRLQTDVIYGGQVGLTMLPDGKGFLWESERDGWNHLYHYALDGTLVNRVTAGDFPVLDVQRVDLQKGFVYLTAHAEPRPYDTHLYRVPLGGGGLQRLTDGTGQHSVQLSPSGEFFIDSHSRGDAPPVAELRTVSGTLVLELDRADASALRTVGWTPPEEFVVKAADGETDLWGVMHKPYDFDPSKSYPVVELIYGGPQVAFTLRNFGGFFEARGEMTTYAKALAQLGFVVVSLDARGTPERSKAFQDVVYGNWGRTVVLDHAAALKQLGRRYDFMDLERVGVFGHSWGGYFAFRALAQAPDVYRLAVASAPGFDPWGAIFYEPYLGLPAGNRAGYADASLFERAPLVAGELMMAVGTSDTFTLTDTITMSHALIGAGVQHEVVLLPGQGHHFVGASMDYFLERQTRFFEKHLQPYAP